MENLRYSAHRIARAGDEWREKKSEAGVPETR